MILENLVVPKYEKKIEIPFFLTFENKDEYRIAELLLDFTGSCTSFELSISGYGAFKPRVVYLSIIKNYKLESLQKTLTGICIEKLDINISRNKPFSPHMTLAFRDLSPQMFYKAWEKYKFDSFQASFKAKSLFLLKHNGKCWDIVYEFPFSTKLPS